LTQLQKIPKVSVIIPCYNHGAFIDEALDSVLQQSFNDFEIIIINDGSTDPFTISHLRSIDKPQITVLHTDNQGLAAARNNGIQAARGEYILPLDADDRIGEIYLEKAVSILDQNSSIGIVYCRAQLFGAWNAEWNLPEYSLDEMLINNIIFCTAFFRKADWEEVGGFDPVMVYGWEDYDFWLALIEKGREVHRIPEILFYYRISADSMVRSREKRQKVETFVKIFHKHESLFKRNIAVWIDKLIDIKGKYYEARLYVIDDNGDDQYCLSTRRVESTTGKLVFDISGVNPDCRLRFCPLDAPIVVKIEHIRFVTDEGVAIELENYSDNAIRKTDDLFFFTTEEPYFLLESPGEKEQSYVITKLVIDLEFVATEKAALHYMIQEQHQRFQNKTELLHQYRRQINHKIATDLQAYPVIAYNIRAVRRKWSQIHGYLFNPDYRRLKKTEFFDPEYYLTENPDVAVSGMDPLVHYLKMGRGENRNPNPFYDANRHLEKNPQITASDGNPLAPKALKSGIGFDSRQGSKSDEFVQEQKRYSCKEIKLAIIILNWNAAKDTLDCIKSINTWSFLAPSVYVVDNNSSEADHAALSAHCHDYQLIMNASNKGFAEGNNVGIRAALKDRCEYILLLNNDARIAEKDTTKLIQTSMSSPEIGIIGPLLYSTCNHELQNAGGKDIGWHYISHLKTAFSKQNVYDVDYVSGTVFLMRSEIFNKIGFLDERYFFSGEIADFCKRVKKYKGQDGSRFRVVVDPRAQGFHDLTASSHHREKLYTYYTVRNRFLYIRKFLFLYLPILYPYWIIRHFNHALACHRVGRNDIVRIILKGVIHGMVGRFGRISNEKQEMTSDERLKG